MEVIEEDGTQQLHITEVKPDSLASAKGINLDYRTYVQNRLKLKSTTVLY